MARSAKSPLTRATDVRTAVSAIAPLLERANLALTQYGADDPRTHAAWEAVEVHGATIHRQARLLAGKSRGG
jgi:hypothetical protein